MAIFSAPAGAAAVAVLVAPAPVAAGVLVGALPRLTVVLLCFVVHGFDPLQGFRFVDSREKCLRFAERGAGSELPPTQSVQLK